MFSWCVVFQWKIAQVHKVNICRQKVVGLMCFVVVGGGAGRAKKIRFYRISSSTPNWFLESCTGKIDEWSQTMEHGNLYCWHCMEWLLNTGCIKKVMFIIFMFTGDKRSIWKYQIMHNTKIWFPAPTIDLQGWLQLPWYNIFLHQQFQF